MKLDKSQLLGFLLIFSTTVYAQDLSMKLWPEEVPNSQITEESEIQEQKNILHIRNVQDPEIAVYLPAGRHATGDAVIICPGGGYHVLAYDWEGISSEMHIYPYGGHGFSLAIGRGYLQSWTERLHDWLKNTPVNE